MALTRRGTPPDSPLGPLPAFLLLAAALCVHTTPISNDVGEELLDGTCGCAFESRSASELVVEVLIVQDSQSRTGAFIPLEQEVQTMTVFFAALDFEHLTGHSVRLFVNCSPFTKELPEWIEGSAPNSGRLDVVSGREGIVRTSGDYCALVQVKNPEGEVVAQGTKTFFAAKPTGNLTEGALSAMADARPRACSASTDSSQCTATDRGRFSEVARHDWPLLECAQPRAPLRVLELRGARWARGRFEIWPGEAGVAALQGFLACVQGSPFCGNSSGGGAQEPALDEELEVGMVRVMHGPIPHDAWCAEGSAGEWAAGNAGLVGYLPVEATIGSTGHLGCCPLLDIPRRRVYPETCARAQCINVSQRLC